MTTFAEEVERFRRWADRVRRSTSRHGEWECEYPDWERLYESAEQFLGEAPRTLAAHKIEQLLYILARDNEDERILQALAAYPRIALQLAHAGVGHSDQDARWQLAVLLGRIRSPEAMALLKQFTQDSDEYVRRRAASAIEAPDP